MNQSIDISEQTLCEKFAFNFVYIDFSDKIILSPRQKTDLKIALQENINIQGNDLIHFTPEILKSILDLLLIHNINIAINELINYIHSRWLKEKHVKLDIHGFSKVFNNEKSLLYRPDVELRACKTEYSSLS